MFLFRKDSEPIEYLKDWARGRNLYITVTGPVTGRDKLVDRIETSSRRFTNGFKRVVTEAAARHQGRSKRGGENFRERTPGR